MHDQELTPKDIELVALLKGRELTRRQVKALGYDITDNFLLKCDFHLVPIYESDDEDQHKIYGVLK
jgi:hypothetical protein